MRPYLSGCEVTMMNAHARCGIVSSALHKCSYLYIIHIEKSPHISVVILRFIFKLTFNINRSDYDVYFIMNCSLTKMKTEI